MPLSEEQLEKMYEKTLETSAILAIIREQFTEYGKRISKIESEQSLLKGKLGAFVLFLTLCGTIMVQGIGWAISHFFSVKGSP